MDTLRKQVHRARARLVIEQFLGRLVWCLFGALALVALAIAVPKVVALEGLPGNWDVACLVGGLVLGLLGSLVWTLVSHRSELEAAIEIDRRFDLKERVSSSLQLSERDLTSAAGTALMKDAVRRVERIEVDERFRVRLARRSWLPLVPAALAFALMLFVEDRTAQSNAATVAKAAEVKAVRRTAQQLKKIAARKRKEAEEKGLKDAEGIFKKLEMQTRELQDKKLDQKKAAIKLNDLAEDIKQRREKIASQSDLKQQFEKLKKISEGPAERLAENLRKGDFRKALDELEKLQKELKDGKLSEEQKEQLTKQLAEMKQKLQEAAEARQQAMENLQKQLAEAQKNGDAAKAAQLQQQLDQMAQSKPQMDKLNQLAQKLAQCQQCMQQGDQEGAANAMQQLAQDIAQMQQQADEMQMLEDALQQIADAKQAMAPCGQCQGKGCQACNGQGFGMGDMFGQNPGMGMGKGRGQGPRPDEEHATNARDSQVRAQPNKGRGVYAGEISGANVKGQVVEEIKKQMAADQREDADPLTNQRLPKGQREHAKEYLTAIGEEL